MMLEKSRNGNFTFRMNHSLNLKKLVENAKKGTMISKQYQ